MSGSTWLVIVGGIAAIAWVNWYFFVAGKSAPAPAVAGAEQIIIVDGGYSPSVVRVKAGRPVRLVFDRRDKGACSDEVVFPDFSVRRFTPSGVKTTIEVTPPKEGRYEFTCGMGMHRGALVAEA